VNVATENEEHTMNYSSPWSWGILGIAAFISSHVILPATGRPAGQWDTFGIVCFGIALAAGVIRLLRGKTS
jgi:hypothetical protein